MAHWAELDSNNIVTRVLVGDNNDPAGDEGYQWLIDNLGGTWVKTSYNAVAGKRRNPETNEIVDEPGFRKNYAGIGYSYDSGRDAFIPPKPFNSWVLNEETCVWDAPVAYPNDGKLYTWNEENLAWDEVAIPVSE
jgi:hypothetical protein